MNSSSKSTSRLRVVDFLMLLVLLLGAVFRFTGLHWGENTYMHPDERFLIWVTADIAPVGSLAEYFDTAQSTLNPNNRGHGFYVYGTLPIFLTRYLVDALHPASPGWEQITIVGRSLSAGVDLLTVLLVYLAAMRLYDRRVGFLAAIFYALAVLPIQLSHFYKEDTFLNFFTFLAIYISIRVLTGDWRAAAAPPQPGGETLYAVSQAKPRPGLADGATRLVQHPFFLLSLGFGVALGCAVASKLNAAPVAAMLPAAFALRIFSEPKETRERRWIEALGYLALAAVASVLVFRLLQPYAFSGPGFFGVRPNPSWVAQIQEQRNQSTGDVDFPPALQWARRPKWFAFQNLVVWGLGLPLGLLAWAGFAWAGWRMLKGDWQRHALLWGWTLFYFAWQSASFNPTMRYLLPVYPALAIFAAWAVVILYDHGRQTMDDRSIVYRLSSVVAKRRGLVGAVLVGGVVLLATLAWAIAFTGIYRRPFTRVEASRWVYQNIPGPINLRIETAEGFYNQPLPYQAGSRIGPEQPYLTGFEAKASGVLSEIYLPKMAAQQPAPEAGRLQAIVSGQPDGSQPLATETMVVDPALALNPGGADYWLPLATPVDLEPGASYYLVLTPLEGSQVVDVCGPIVLHFQSPEGQEDQSLASSPQCMLQGAQSLNLPFSSQAGGLLSGVTFTHAMHLKAEPEPETLVVSIAKPNAGEELASGVLRADLKAQDGPDSGYAVQLDRPVEVKQGETYRLALSVPAGSGKISLAGAALANESTWDDPIPLRLDGYDGYGGIYQGDLNFEMYWDDNPEKLARFLDILNRADYILISSNRQWGTTTRVPERYPLTSEYYRRLMGCPPERSVVWCYNVAQAGTFQGDLGFELVKVFDASPRLGPLTVNDQFAEEAFTVYDHPKVFIFRRSANFDREKVSSILRSVDLSKAVHITPRRVGSYPANLMLPDERWNEQRTGGTWSELFNTSALQNRSQAAAVLVWYLGLGLLGLMVYPLLRVALPGLADGGYPLARTAGLLLLSYLVWLGGSFRLPFSRETITAAVALLALAGLAAAIRQRRELLHDLRSRGGYFLLVEALFLVFFLFDLAIRWGNPDLWHPYHGGEKPMDFAYFNAVLKSTSFPPYDPWFAGGYLNYYYYGFMLAGVLVKWLGIVPAVAYNLILPTIFSLIALGAFSVAWNLAEGRRTMTFAYGDGDDGRWSSVVYRLSSIVVGVAAALSVAVLGNLGTVRMIWRGYQMVAAPGGTIEGANFFTRLGWAFQGFLEVLAGGSLPYGIGDWYWLPSRAIPAPGDIEPITEFPFFTVLYGDPHAHLFALPITLLVLAFALSVVLSRGRWRSWLGAGAGFFLGGLAAGALRPTNTWDFYPYLPLASVAVGYGLWQAYCSGTRRLIEARSLSLIQRLPEAGRRLLLATAGVLLLATLAFLVFQPYAQWYGQGYNQIALWKGTHTPTGSYLVHWGLFLFLIVSWMSWETRDWMASTPVSSLRKLDPYRGVFLALAGLLLVAILMLVILLEVAIAWLVLPLMAWAGLLILRPGQSEARRFVLFLIGTALALTLMVEIVVLVGDIGRMNTVFKFYLVAWTLLAVSAAAALGWVLEDIELWWPRWRAVWQAALAVLVFSAALYPLMAGMAKVKNRMTLEAPRGLDGMAYMAYGEYPVDGQPMALDQDYRAIRWMQENVAGSPVIVEGHLTEYLWGSRFSIYTGLPSVIGWNWHQRQQRVIAGDAMVWDRVRQVDEFYQTTDLAYARDFLRRYSVRYVVLGRLERGHYPGPGLDKFPAADGSLWREVYREGETVIYEVIESG